MPGAGEDLARQAAQGLGGEHVSHVRPSLLCLGLDFATCDGGSHFVFAEFPGQVNDAIARFVDSLGWTALSASTIDQLAARKR